MIHTHSQSSSSSLTADATRIDPTGPLGPLPGFAYIARGTFGLIYSKDDSPDSPEVYKVVEFEENAAALQTEFELYQSVFSALSTSVHTGHSNDTFVSPDSRSVFCTPRPGSFYAPPTTTQYNSRMIPASHHVPVSPMSTPSLNDFSSIPHPAMTLARIPDLPIRLTSTYRKLFWRDQLYASGPPIRLLRLYLGRAFPETSSLIAPGIMSDPPLDIARYRALDTALRSEAGGTIGGLPALEDVSRGMGEVLAKLHFEVGTNGRDVELVLGGEAPRCWILDYNQSAPWLSPRLFQRMSKNDTSSNSAITAGAYAANTLCEAARRLGILIATQEFYYPRPDNPLLYPQFRAGYASAVEDLISRCAPTEIHTRWSTFAEDVRAAVARFFEAYEEVAAARAERGTRLSREGK